MNQFLQKMNNPDEDFAVIELQNIIGMFDKYHEISLLANYEDFFILTILQHLSSKKLELVETIFRVIVLLAQYFNIEKIPSIFDQLIKIAQSRECEIKPQILSVFKEILSNHVFYDAERNKKIFDSLFAIVKSDISRQLEENLGFVIDLYTSLLHNLGSLASQEELQETLDSILKLLDPNASKDRETQLRSIANLTKEWCKYTSNLEELLSFLFSPNFENSQTPHIILSAVASANPKGLKNHLKQLFTLFYDATKIGNDSADNEAGGDEDNDDDMFNEGGADIDAEMIKTVQSSIESLAILLRTFPSEMSPHESELLSLFYNYVSYEIVDADDESDAEDIEIELDEGMQDSDVDDEDNNVGIGEDSWKLRKAATVLGFSLIKSFGPAFISDLVSSHVDSVTLALKDTDVGAKKDILELMVTIVTSFPGEVTPDVYGKWVSLIASQCKTSDANIVATLTAFAQLVQSVSVDSAAITTVVDSLVEGQTTVNIAREVVSLSVALMRGQCDFAPFAVSVAVLLTRVMQLGNLNFATQAMATAAILYSHAPTSDAMVELNRAIIEAFEQGGERKIPAIHALSVFAATHASDETARESIEAIVSSLENDITARAALEALTLIANYAPESVAAVSERVFPELIKRTLSHEQVFVFRALWVINMLTQKSLIGIATVAQSAKEIMAAGTTADVRSRAVAYRILAAVAESVDIYDETVQTLLNRLATEALPKKALSECAKFLTNIALTAPEKMTGAVLKLIEQCSADSDSTKRTNQCIAFCIGRICAKSDTIRATVLNTIREPILKMEDSSAFSILCFGEIYSAIEIAETDDLFRAVLSYLSPEKPRHIFNSAATAVGYIAAGNVRTVLPTLLKIANGQEENFGFWLKALQSFTEKVITEQLPKLKNSSNEELNESLHKTADYLMKPREIKKEVTQMLSESLSNIALIDNGFASTLLSTAANTASAANIAVVAADAIADFFSTADERSIDAFFDGVAELARADNPTIAASVLLALKSSLRFRSFLQRTADRHSAIVACTVFDPSHKVTVGTELEKTTIDIGRAMRCNAVDLLALIHRMDASLLSPDELVETAIGAISDPETDVSIRALQLMTDLSLSDESKDIVSEHAKLIAEAFTKVHKAGEEIQQDVELPLYRCVAAAQYATRAAPCLDIEKVRQRYKDSALMTKAEEDVQSEIQTMSAKTTSEASMNVRSEPKILLEKVNREAAAIYSS